MIVVTILTSSDSSRAQDPHYGWFDLPSIITVTNTINNPASGILSTGFADLDEIFNGSLPNGVIMQLYGPEGSGKTQFVLHSIVASALNGNKVLLIDCCNGIHIIRLRNILLHRVRKDGNIPAERIGAVVDIALSNIQIEKAFDIFSALDLLCKASDSSLYHFVAIDSYHRLFAQFLPVLDHSGDFNWIQ